MNYANDILIAYHKKKMVGASESSLEILYYTDSDDSEINELKSNITNYIISNNTKSKNTYGKRKHKKRR